VWDLAATLEEFGTLRFAPTDVPPGLYSRFWAASERRDPEALRAVCRGIREEGLRRMLSEDGAAGSRRRAV
jgi:hypothetical protein